MPQEQNEEALSMEPPEHHSEHLRYMHPEIWPFAHYRINGNHDEPMGAYLVSRGCLAAPTAGLSRYIQQPMALSTDGYYYNYDAPSLTKTLLSCTNPYGRWKENYHDRGNTDEISRMETLVLAPKSRELRMQSLEALHALEQNPLTPAVVQSYLDARLVKKQAIVTSSGQTFPKDSTIESLFHGLHDMISSGSPNKSGSYSDCRFYQRDIKSKDYYPPIVLKTYAKHAREAAKLLGGQMKQMVMRGFSAVEPLLRDYRTTLTNTRKESTYGPKKDEVAAYAWYSAISRMGYYFLDNFDIRHNQLHWSAAILDYFVNLHLLYQQLNDKKIQTCIPIIGPAIQASGLMHMNRSLETIADPDRKPEPVDITIPSNRSVIFIGSNNSGKSFTMEMIAANAQESMLGRKTFAKSFESPEFDAIIAIPAELPQETGKSTYTGQLGLLVDAIREIVEIQSVKPDAQILLMADELYAGTDEHDSAALYKATIEWLSAHHVTLIGATNNELVFDPEVAEFVSMVDRKPVVILQSEDIVAKRQGIPMLQQAGMPEEVIQRAYELCGIEPPTFERGEEKPPREFTGLRSAQTLGFLETSYTRNLDIGRNLILWDMLPRHPVFFNKVKTLERTFGSDSHSPEKQLYRSWFDAMPVSQRSEMAEHFRTIPEAMNAYVSMEYSIRNDRDSSSDHLFKRSVTIIETAREQIERLQLARPFIDAAPNTLRDTIMPAYDTLLAALTRIVAISTDESNKDGINREVIQEISTFWNLPTDMKDTIDSVSVFFHLSQLFKEHNFCRATHNDTETLETTELYHTKLRYEFAKTDTVLTTNDLLIQAGSPTILLGANASGKTTLAESLGIAAFFALHFDFAPAAAFSLGKNITNVAVLTDYLRDPDRPQDAGKWLSRQTQIASIVAAAKDGGYLVILDEPGEGTNGFEGRATLIALAEYLTAHGNTVVFTTHQHKAVETLETTTGVQAYASGLGTNGRFSFAKGKASSLGLEMALEEGLLPEIVARAHEIKTQLTATQE